ncbi:dynein regulatory complex protein 10-like [Cydia splendana]|uniref:dynein regulatory complex protein 10-like n=1 Tax=Cydia splendana TaxID=1100963 RepID=UPI00300C098F
MTEVSASSLSEHTSDSSKTGSSKTSEHSGTKVEPERDDGSSPMDMERIIQTDRITKSLDKLVYQTKLAICINNLMNDNILANILTKKHLDAVTSTIYQYHRPVYEYAASLINIAAADDISAGDLSLKNRVNPDLCFMMYTLCSYPELKPHVERITEQVKGPSVGLKYLQKLEEFRDLMVIQMKTTAADELAAIINTRKLEKSNNESLEKIREDKECLEQEKLDHEQIMREKLELIEQLKQELELNHHKAIIKRKKEILDSERQMVVATRAHTVKYQMLKEEAEETQDGYHSLLHRGLLAEKQLRDRRRKCEVQLQSWLQKYDVEMIVKQEELDELIKVHEEEREKIEVLKVIYGVFS